MIGAVVAGQTLEDNHAAIRRLIGPPTVPRAHLSVVGSYISLDPCIALPLIKDAATGGRGAV